jgi:putative heme iron utilization protein
VRYIGGYGRMSWVDIADWRGGQPDPIAPHASAIIEHMNADHADAMVAFCRALTRATDTAAATMTGVDRYGFEMSAQTGRGPRPIRLPFPEPIATPEDARRAMVALVRRARELLPAGEEGTSKRT